MVNEEGSINRLEYFVQQLGERGSDVAQSEVIIPRQGRPIGEGDKE